jgi:hypothetical protein
MLSLSRSLPAALVVAGLAIFATSPTTVRAQAKKDAKKDPPPAAKPEEKKNPPKPEGKDDGDPVAFATSDGLSLKGYWFQGVGIEKRRPDAVMMFPAPGSKVTDAWIELAKALSKKNYSVLLFDWRGCGMNGVDAGARIFENTEAFWREQYNSVVLKDRQRTIEEKGLEYARLVDASKTNLRYRDFLPNDLMGARFYLDRMSDNGRCNTNRVWIVSEKDGAGMGLAFIAYEFHRNSIFAPVRTPGVEVPFKSAGKDYAGLVALSYADTNPTARAVYRNALNTAPKEARDHLESRLALILVNSKKEGPTHSKNLIGQLGVSTSDEKKMKDNFKYLRDVDTKDKDIKGIGMLDNQDTFKLKDTVLDTMVGVSKAQPFGNDATDRQANKMTVPPRFPAELFSRR